MTLEVLWFVLAGFVLGFAVSTLWEWFYYRGKRLGWRDERVAELEATLAQRPAQSETPLANPPDESRHHHHSTDTVPSPAPAEGTVYRSRAILLRSEQETERERTQPSRD